jgi:SAM-dependent methyltransferase
MAHPEPNPNSGERKSWEQAVAWLCATPEHSALVKAGYYDDPLQAAAVRFFESPEWQAVRNWMPPDAGSALDLGAGRGIASFALAREGLRVYALEPDGSNLVGAGAIRDLASSCALPIEVIQEFSERIPLPDKSVDFVYARAVLHHTKDLHAACREICRVLRPGGVFVGSRDHVISHRSDLPTFLASHPLHRLYGGENAFLLSEYLGAIRSSGLELRACLGPLESPMNYAPRSLPELRLEIAHRISRGSPLLKGVLATTLAAGPVWNVVSRVISRLDRRPGRLYSFVTSRPL